jgi:hypothetical protein
MMFAVIAVVVGVMSAFAIVTMTGHGLFDFLTKDVSSTSTTINNDYSNGESDFFQENQISIYSCIDSDGGIISGVAGTCTDISGGYRDSCTPTDDLLEYYCSKPEKRCKAVEIDCLEGNPACWNGTCAGKLSNWDYRIMNAAFIPNNITSIIFEVVDNNYHPPTLKVSKKSSEAVSTLVDG